MYNKFLKWQVIMLNVLDGNQGKQGSSGNQKNVLVVMWHSINVYKHNGNGKINWFLFLDLK